MVTMLAQQQPVPRDAGAILLWIVMAVAAVTALVTIIILNQVFALWLQGMMAGANINFWTIIGMRFRKINVRQIVQAKIVAVQAGLEEVSVEMLQDHYLAGGHVDKVVQALAA